MSAGDYTRADAVSDNYRDKQASGKADHFDDHAVAAQHAWDHRGDLLVVVRCDAPIRQRDGKVKSCRGEIAKVYATPRGPLLAVPVYIEIRNETGRHPKSIAIFQTGGRRAAGQHPELWLLRFTPSGTSKPWTMPDSWDGQCSHSHGKIAMTKHDLDQAAERARRPPRRKETLLLAPDPRARRQVGEERHP